MANNELLLAISDMLDVKLEAKLTPISQQLNKLEHELSKTNFNVEKIEAGLIETSDKLEKLA